MSRLAPLHALDPLVLRAALATSPPGNGFELSAAFALLVAHPLTLRIGRDAPEWLRRVAFFAGVITCVSHSPFRQDRRRQESRRTGSSSRSRILCTASRVSRTRRAGATPACGRKRPRSPDRSWAARRS